MSRLRIARECAAVKRCHTVPIVGEYTVGQHSHDALSLYLLLCPEPRLDVVRAIHFHDYGERWTGDVPAPAKWAAPGLRELTEALEARCLSAHGFSLPDLDEEGEAWLKGVDLLELYLWAQDQVCRGNRNLEPMVEKILEHVASLPDDAIPAPVRAAYRREEWSRSTDTLPPRS